MLNHLRRVLPALALAATLQAGPAPTFTLKTLDGTSFRLADHLGKQVIVLDFWATWCGPCTKSLKKLQELKAKYPDVLVLAVSIDDGQSMAQVNQYVRGKGFTFTVLLDPDSSVIKQYNPTGSVPTAIVLDRKGQVAYTHTGYLPGDEQALQQKVEALRR